MKTLERISRWLEWHSLGKVILLSVVVGVVAGCGAIAFDVIGQAVSHFTLTQFAGYVPAEAAGEHARFEHSDTGTLSLWLIVLIMVIGGLVSGVLVYTYAPEAEGHGTDAAIDAFHNRQGKVRGRVPIIKTIASAITLGTGGSGGREGPIAQIGAGFGSWLGSKLNLTARERRIMLAAGMGAGIGAIFRAPLAGAVFAGEILYSEADLEADVVVPAAASSIVAYSVYTQSLPADTRFVPLFGENLEHTFQTPVELLPYAVLALVLTIAGLIYVNVFYGTQKLFHKIPILPHIKPAIGAGFAGLLAIGLVSGLQDERILGVLGTGYGTLQLAVTQAQSLGVGLLILVAMVKILTTSLTISSGGSGGVFGPSMVIGGCLGAAIGLIFHAWIPEVVPEPEAFAVVGMAGFFSGIARAPISTIIMVRALTGDYGLLLPTMLVSTLTFVLSSRCRLYRKQVANRMDSKAHSGDFIVDVLEDLIVKDVAWDHREMTLINEAATLDEIVHSLANNQQHYFPVVDNENRMVGIFSDNDVRAYLYDDALWNLANARDVMTSNVLAVTPADNLNTALKQFTTLNLDEIPVVDPDDTGRLLGMLRRKEIIAAYNQKLMAHKQETAEET